MYNLNFAPGAYIIENQRSSTVLDLANGSSASGTIVQGWQNLWMTALTFNQIWIIRRHPKYNDSYTIVNARSGTYLDLSNGSDKDGTQVQCWSDSNSLDSPNDNQTWKFLSSRRDSGSESGAEYYWIVNRASGTVIDLGGGRQDNGTRVQGWRRMTNECQPNQMWQFKLRSRNLDEVTKLLLNSPAINKSDFGHYPSDDMYLTLPVEVIDYIWKSKSELGQRKWRRDSYDCDDYAFAMKAAVGTWCYENIRAPVAICFGIFFGRNPAAGHAYNWYINQTLDSIVLFEPQNGSSSSTTNYKAYFGVF